MPKVILSITNIYRLTTKSFLIILFSLFISASLAGLFVSSAHAETVKYDVNVNSSLTLGFSANTVSLNLNPGSKTFASQDITTTVSTNNQYGYDLYVTSDGTDLINQTDNTKTISTLPAKEGGYDAETFLADKWGVMKNNTSYQPFVSGTTVSQSSTVTNADNTVLTFGAKTSYNTAPGNYKLLLNFQLVARVATNDLTINFAGEGVESVKVCKVAGDCTGDDYIGSVTTSGGSVPGLKDGSSYYLYPTFSSGYEFVSWAKTSSDASVISDTTILNPTFTMSDEPASVTVTGKATEYAITLVKTNAAAIVIDGTSYSGSSATLTYGNHTISGTYASGYEFSSWASNSTNLAITSTSSASTTITVHGAATLTLTGKTKLYIQDFTKAMCSSQASSSAVTVYDKRDEKSYTVRYINGNCWMTQNLRFSGSKIDSTNTNINTTKTIYWGDLTAGGTDFSNARYHYSNNTTNGYWYNYAGASAMTIIGSANATNATYDICPKNWRLPTNLEFSGIESYSSAFSPATGGYYYNGSLYSAEVSGSWWSATADDDDSAARHTLDWNQNDSSLVTRHTARSIGIYVRCIRSS